MLIHCCRYVFNAPLPSKERGADHRKHRSYIVARVRFYGNVFTEPLLSNKPFRLSGVITQYLYLRANIMYRRTYTVNYLFNDAVTRADFAALNDTITE
jgi:hypothetical protein